MGQPGIHPPKGELKKLLRKIQSDKDKAKNKKEVKRK